VRDQRPRVSREGRLPVVGGLRGKGAMDPDRFSSVSEFYDRHYHGDPGRDERHLSWHTRRVAARLGSLRGAQVLDVACGQGAWLGELQQRGAFIAGTDISGQAIDICARRLPQGEFRVGPAESLPFADGRFDLVTSLGALEHFLDKRTALLEMQRVAASHARFLLLVPIAGFLTRRLGLYRGTEQAQIREDVLEIEDWEQLFADAGLQVVARWRDLHPLSWGWINRGSPALRVVRALQAAALAVWPLRWQYQVYFLCERALGRVSA
jgi:SAM-dependent methyltransferase